MTFYADRADAEKRSHTPIPETCAVCGDALGWPVVQYDVLGEEKDLWMHRDCAFAMAQRIICDAWPHRRVNEWMENKR